MILLSPPPFQNFFTHVVPGSEILLWQNDGPFWSAISTTRGEERAIARHCRRGDGVWLLTRFAAVCVWAVMWHDNPFALAC